MHQWAVNRMHGRGARESKSNHRKANNKSGRKSNSTKVFARPLASPGAHRIVSSLITGEHAVAQRILGYGWEKSTAAAVTCQLGSE